MIFVEGFFVAFALWLVRLRSAAGEVVTAIVEMISIWTGNDHIYLWLMAPVLALMHLYATALGPLVAIDQQSGPNFDKKS